MFVTASRSRRSAAGRSSAASGGMRSISRVESTMSVKRRKALSDASTGIAPTRLHVSPTNVPVLPATPPASEEANWPATSHRCCLLPGALSNCRPSTRPPRAAAPSGCTRRGPYWLPSCMIGNPLPLLSRAQKWMESGGEISRRRQPGGHPHCVATLWRLSNGARPGGLPMLAVTFADLLFRARQLPSRSSALDWCWRSH